MYPCLLKTLIHTHRTHRSRETSVNEQNSTGPHTCNKSATLLALLLRHQKQHHPWKCAQEAHTWYVDPASRTLGGTLSQGDSPRYVGGSGEDAGCDTTDQRYDSVDFVLSHWEKAASPLERMPCRVTSHVRAMCRHTCAFSMRWYWLNVSSKLRKINVSLCKTSWVPCGFSTFQLWQVPRSDMQNRM
jgi:hypothetical protein